MTAPSMWLLRVNRNVESVFFLFLSMPTSGRKRLDPSPIRIVRSGIHFVLAWLREGDWIPPTFYPCRE